MLTRVVLAWACLVIPAVLADTPANCTYEQILGKWQFSIGKGGNDNTLKCSPDFQTVSQYNVRLYFPDVAIDDDGNKGFWTLIYNQGFEVAINNRRLFAFSSWQKDVSTNKVVSQCDITKPGWVHNFNETDWACIVGKQMNGFPSQYDSPERPQPLARQPDSPQLYGELRRLYKPNDHFINAINKQQSSWTAGHYAEYDQMTIGQLLQRSGGRRSGRAFPNPAPVTENIAKEVEGIPEEFDWRNVDGVNYVSPIRNQEACGSCYAFASMAMHEARLRIRTNNTDQRVFSPQDVVSCSEYSQGCDGGFPYLIGGKYAEDFGLIEESCFTYTGHDDPCKKSTCKRYMAGEYGYVGGFYGACNEALMRLELVRYGPVVIGFEVYPDFEHYKSGIYHHTGLQDGFNPFEITNHAVLIVGYGADPQTKEKFWIVKNSWGATWGENGYFRIRRDTDECGIESIAVTSYAKS